MCVCVRFAWMYVQWCAKNGLRGLSQTGAIFHGVRAAIFAGAIFCQIWIHMSHGDGGVLIFFGGGGLRCTLWWTNIWLWKITIFNGKIHYFYGHFQ